MYTDHDVLASFRDEVARMLPPDAAAELPPLPRMGDLDLLGVLDSAYFFA
jgi:DNA-directed RNA polymerase